MEEEIEVGEWIRSKDGFIGKVQKINYDNMEKSNYYICEKDNVMASNYLENIAKHSKQLIDLIEKDDYVNGSKVLAVMEDMETGELHLEMTSNYTNEEIGDCTIYDKDIKIILTKESYMDNCYKVGGEDE